MLLRSVLKRPCEEAVLALVVPVLGVVRAYNELWSPTSLAALHPSIVKAHALPLHEKQVIIGVPPHKRANENGRKVSYVTLPRRALGEL